MFPNTDKIEPYHFQCGFITSEDLAKITSSTKHSKPVEIWINQIFHLDVRCCTPEAADLIKKQKRAVLFTQFKITPRDTATRIEHIVFHPDIFRKLTTYAITPHFHSLKSSESLFKLRSVILENNPAFSVTLIPGTEEMNSRINYALDRVCGMFDDYIPKLLELLPPKTHRDNQKFKTLPPHLKNSTCHIERLLSLEDFLSPLTLFSDSDEPLIPETNKQNKKNTSSNETIGSEIRNLFDKIRGK